MERLINGWVFSKWFSGVIRAVLGIIFITAGVLKISEPQEFAKLISMYNLVPDPFLVPVAVGLPLLEIMAGLGLVFNIRVSLEVITALLLMFIFVLWFGILRDLDIDCGCFSTEELAGHDDLRSALYRDFVMLAAAVYLFVWKWVDKRRKKEVVSCLVEKELSL